MIDICLVNWSTEIALSQHYLASISKYQTLSTSQPNATSNLPTIETLNQIPIPKPIQDPHDKFHNGVLVYTQRNIREPPTGLMLLANILIDRGYSVDLIDCAILEDPESYLLSIAQKYRLFGFTSLTNNFSGVISVANLLHQENPEAYMVMGGPHASFTYREILETYSFIHFVFLGESETSFPWLIETLLKAPAEDFFYENLGDISQTQCSEVTLSQVARSSPPVGISYRNSEGGVVDSIFPPSTDLTALPLPARHIVPPIYNIADIIVNRGCPNKCSFCTRTKLFPEMRVRPLDQVIAEIKDILSYPNYQFANFYDNININRSYFTNFLDSLIEMKFPLPWGAELRADVLSSDEIEKIKISNGKLIATGVESASKEVLQRNFKFQNPEKVANGIRNLKAGGLAVQAYFVIGLPGDTLTSFQETLDFAATLPFEPERDQLNFFVTTPYPGSDLYENQEKYQISINERNYDLYNCQEILMTTGEANLEEIRQMVKMARDFKKKWHFH